VSQSKTTIVWFRNDLRLRDNPALHAAVEEGVVVPVFIWDDTALPAEFEDEQTRFWFHHSLDQLDKALGRFGSRLIIRRGIYGRVLRELMQQSGATSLFWNHDPLDPYPETRRELCHSMEDAGYFCREFTSTSLVQPAEFLDCHNQPFMSFAHFYAAVIHRITDISLIPPSVSVPTPSHWPRSAHLTDLGLIAHTSVETPLPESEMPGEEGAWVQLHSILQPAAKGQFAASHPQLAASLASLIQHLRFGAISPRQVMSALLGAEQSGQACPSGDAILELLARYEYKAYRLHYHLDELQGVGTTPANQTAE